MCEFVKGDRLYRNFDKERKPTFRSCVYKISKCRKLIKAEYEYLNIDFLEVKGLTKCSVIDDGWEKWMKK